MEPIDPANLRQQAKSYANDVTGLLGSGGLVLMKP